MGSPSTSCTPNAPPEGPFRLPPRCTALPGGGGCDCSVGTVRRNCGRQVDALVFQVMKLDSY